MVNFPTWIPDCDSHSPALLDILISSDASICSSMVFPPLGNSDHFVVSVSIDFPINSKQDVSFHHIDRDYSCADWDSLQDHLKDVSGLSMNILHVVDKSLMQERFFKNSTGDLLPALRFLDGLYNFCNFVIILSLM